MKIIGFEQNYIDYVNKSDNKIKEPVFYLLPDSSLLLKNKPFYYPDFSDDINYATEIVVKISRLGKNIEQRFAYRYYSEIAIVVSFTACDILHKLKNKGLPWSLAKGFDYANALSSFVSFESIAQINNISFNLNINDNCVQAGNTKDMIFSVDELIAYLSKFMTLKIGDLIFTGTPAGIGQIKQNDRLQAAINNDTMLDFKIK